MSAATRLVVIHPGDGSWGSDSVLLRTAEVLREMNPDAQLELWHEESNVDRNFLLRFPGDARRIRTLVLRRRNLNTFRAVAMLMLPFYLVADVRRMRDVRQVFINTCVPFSALIAAGITRRDGWVHVHEIPQHRFEQIIFSLVVAFSGLRPLYISDAVRLAFRRSLGGRLSNRLDGPVVLNGVDPAPFVPAPIDDDPEGPLSILCLGRFSSWKGQDVLLDALALLDEHQVPYDVRLVGLTTAADFEYLELLRVKQAALQGRVEFIAYTDRVHDHYEWSDVVVVPSTRPEPFGLSAAEGALMGRPVIASSHGGLVEIVRPGITGALIPPGDPAALADVLLTYAKDRMLLIEHGNEAQRHAESEFGHDAFADRMRNAIRTAS
ncbi:MAG: glycosyltransferase family 4 protein [Acidimicrobiales bacterium]|nr:glycosyltransferase family 4 protein [Acidimicrobiales bacterium]